MEIAPCEEAELKVAFDLAHKGDAKSVRFCRRRPIACTPVPSAAARSPAFAPRSRIDGENSSAGGEFDWSGAFTDGHA